VPIPAGGTTESVPLPVTLEQLRRELNMSDPDQPSDNDGELTIRLAAATRAVEAIVGPMVPRSVISTRTARGGCIVLPIRPVVSVESVNGLYGAASYALGDLDLWDLGSGLIRLGYGCLPFGRYTVAYTVGRTEVGENLQLAVLIIAAHLWETQRGKSARARSLGEFDSGNPSQDAILVLRGYAYPRRALELLQADDPGLVFA
jgi:hypothetical protein